MFRRLAIALVAVAPLTFAATAQAEYDPFDPYGDDQPDSSPTIDTPVCFGDGENRDVMLDFVFDETGVSQSDREDQIVDTFDYVCNGAWLVFTPEQARKFAELDVPGIVSYAFAGSFELPIEAEDMQDMTGRGYDYTPQVLSSAMQRIGVEQHLRSAGVDVGVGIIDTGVDMLHDDLNVVGGYDCTFHDPGRHGDVGGWGVDSHGHATHVAGIIAAEDNDRFVVGAAPGARIYSYKVFGAGGSASYAQVMCGVDKAMRDAQAGLVDVVNMSLGGPNEPSVCPGSSVDHNAICALANLVPVIVAAGNDGVDAVFKSPASYPEAITVSALTDPDGQPGELAFPSAGCGFAGEDDALAPFSNYGSAVDFIAPGVCVLSLAPGNQMAYMSGTSMATPVVAGVFAEYIARCGPEDARETIALWSSQSSWTNGQGEWNGDVGPDAEPLIRLGAPCA